MSMTPAVIIVVYFVASILLKGLSSLNPADDFMSQKEKEDHGTGTSLSLPRFCLLTVLRKSCLPGDRAGAGATVRSVDSC